jgi:hypothetical protein
MTFRIYDRARKHLLRMGFAAAPFAIAWHGCPKSDENPFNPPPEHVEQHVHHETDLNSIVMQALPPPPLPPMPFHNYDGSNDVVMQSHAQRNWAGFLASATSNQTSAAVLWYASTQAAQQPAPVVAAT